MKTTNAKTLRFIGSITTLLMVLGTSARANLLVNGDFSAGNTGFATDYNFSTFNLGGGGEYTITADPHSWNLGLLAAPAWFDHTATSDNLSLLINGAPTAGLDMWRQTIAVTPNTDYLFSGWASDTYPAAGGAQGLVQFYVNGSPVGAPLAVVDQTGVPNWQELSVQFNSGSASSLTVSLRDLDLTWEANDLALDDLSIVVVPEPSSVVIGGLGAIFLLRIKRQPQCRMNK